MTKTIPAIRVESIALSTGVPVEYASQGTPSEAPPIVFLHGVTDSWRSFEGVLAHLPNEVRALALSQRGHGNSGRPSTGYRYEDMARDVRAFLDALRIPRALIVGHSMGAMVALDKCCPGSRRSGPPIAATDIDLGGAQSSRRIETLGEVSVE